MDLVLVMAFFTSQLYRSSQPEDVDTVRFSVCLTRTFQGIGLSGEDLYDVLIISSPNYHISSSPYYLVDQLTPILMEPRVFFTDDVWYIIQQFFRLLDEELSSDDYHQGCALRLRLDLAVLYSPEEISRFNFGTYHEADEAVQSLLEDVVQLSFDEIDSIMVRPASKIAVSSLSRKVYNKTSDSVGEDDMCTICLEEFKDGRNIVTLSCGHEFDEECIVEWFGRNHVCPLCRFELPYEDDDKVEGDRDLGLLE